MYRLCRWELFTPDEKAIVHVMNRTVRRCFLFGDDEITGRNYDYRKDWIELAHGVSGSVLRDRYPVLFDTLQSFPSGS